MKRMALVCAVFGLLFASVAVCCDEDEFLGVGQVGLFPFATGALHPGFVDVRAHYGRVFFDEQVDNSPRPPDISVFGVGLFAEIVDNVGVRAELLGTNVESRDFSSQWTFQPGLDLGVALDDGITLILRPTGLIGLTGEAFDWGAGLSVALTAH